MIHAEVRALVSVVNIAAVTAGDREREKETKRHLRGREREIGAGERLFLNAPWSFA